LYCQHCGIEEPLPFRCPSCGGFFCTTHRLPEQHQCTGTRKIPSMIETPPEPFRVPSYRHEFTWTPSIRRRTFWFSPTEILHVLIGIALVSAVGLSIPMGSFGIFNIMGTLLSVALFSLGFLLHELSHKFVAQLHGLWAEFRLSTTGALVTAISIISPIKFIAPGSVLIAGTATSPTIGKLAVAGPLANLAVAFASALAFLLSRNAMLRLVLASGSWVNAYMALFNLIPFGEFDGLKVFRWSKVVWSIILASAAILLFMSSYYVFR